MRVLDSFFSIGFIRKSIWRLWYPFVTRRLRSEDVLFLNYAFESDPSVDLELSAEDEPNRPCIQLYHHTATQVNLTGREVLEVSCGHGGGASWIARSLGPLKYTGLDLNSAGIQLCRRRHKVKGLEFIQGDAQSLPFPDNSVDAVINVEASHCYPDFPGFLREVNRVLRPGGHFLYADFRFSDLFEAWDKAIAEAPLQLIQSRVINPEVIRGMERNGERNRALVARHLPKFLHGVGNDFAGVPGSRLYVGMQDGTISYRSYCFQKRS